MAAWSPDDKPRYGDGALHAIQATFREDELAELRRQRDALIERMDANPHLSHWKPLEWILPGLERRIRERQGCRCGMAVACDERYCPHVPVREREER